MKEGYLCSHCNKEYSEADVYEGWQCPICNRPISIKVKIVNSYYNCYKLKPVDLQKGFIVTFDNINTHEIIEIQKIGKKYKIALRNYGLIAFDQNMLFLVINGAWTYN